MVKRRDEHEDGEHLDMGGPYNEQVYPCGCRVRVCLCGCDNEPDIVDCAMHGAAEEVLKALKAVLEDTRGGTTMATSDSLWKRARRAVKVAEEKKKGGRDGR